MMEARRVRIHLVGGRGGVDMGFRDRICRGGSIMLRSMGLGGEGGGRGGVLVLMRGSG
jgi:hypothetical protein